MKKMALLFLCSIFCTYYAIGQSEISSTNFPKKLFTAKGSSQMEKQFLDKVNMIVTEEIQSQKNRVRNDDFVEKLDSLILEEEEKYVYTYDENGLTRTKTISYWRYQTNEWGDGEKYEYEYNADGDLILEKIYMANHPDPGFIHTHKAEYTYNASGELLEEIISHYDDNVYSLSEKKTSYYENSLKIADTSFIYYDIDATWYPEGAISYTYNEDDNLIAINTSLLDDIWMEIGKIEIEYENELISVITIFDCDEEGCYEYMKMELSYDGNDVLISITTYEMDYYENDEGEEESEWFADTKYDFNYDSQIPSSSIMVPEWYTFDYKIENVEISYFYENGWEVEEEYSFYYSGFTTVGIHENTIRDLKIYPNPVSNNMTISMEENYKTITFELYSMDGKKLLEKQINSSESVSMEGLSKGLYIYNITADGKKQSGKIVKQ